MTELSDKADYIERILAATKVERYFYLGICTASAAVLLLSAGFMLLQHHGDASTITSLFGSTGIITFSGTQVMRVWSDAMKFVLPAGKDDSH